MNLKSQKFQTAILLILDCTSSPTLIDLYFIDSNIPEIKQ